MSCPDFEKLMLYLDGELHEEELHRVREHLEGCVECRRVLATQSRLEESWRSGFSFPEGSEFRRMEDRIFRRVHGRRGWRSIIPVAAGIIAVLLGVKLILSENPSLDRVSSTAMEWTEDYSLESNRGEVRGRAGEPSGPEATGPVQETPEDTAEQPLEEQEELIEGMIADHDRTGEPATRSLLDETASAQHQVASEVTDDMEETVGSAFGGGALRGSDQAGQDEILDIADAAVSEEETAGLLGRSVEHGAEEDREPEAGIADTSVLQSAPAVPDMTGISTSESESCLSAGPEEVEAQQETVSLEEGIAYCPSEYYNRLDDGYLVLAFDENGMPDSMTAVLLDSLSPGWRDYIQSEFMDTVMVVPLSDLNDLLWYGGGVPAETTD